MEDCFYRCNLTSINLLQLKLRVLFSEILIIFFHFYDNIVLLLRFFSKDSNSAVMHGCTTFFQTKVRFLSRLTKAKVQVSILRIRSMLVVKLIDQSIYLFTYQQQQSHLVVGDILWVFIVHFCLFKSSKVDMSYVGIGFQYEDRSIRIQVILNTYVAKSVQVLNIKLLFRSFDRIQAQFAFKSSKLNLSTKALSLSQSRAKTHFFYQKVESYFLNLFFQDVIQGYSIFYQKLLIMALSLTQRSCQKLFKVHKSIEVMVVGVKQFRKDNFIFE